MFSPGEAPACTLLCSSPDSSDLFPVQWKKNKNTHVKIQAKMTWSLLIFSFSCSFLEFYPIHQTKAAHSGDQSNTQLVLSSVLDFPVELTLPGHTIFSPKYSKQNAAWKTEILCHCATWGLNPQATCIFPWAQDWLFIEWITLWYNPFTN